MAAKETRNKRRRGESKRGESKRGGKQTLLAHSSPSCKLLMRCCGCSMRKPTANGFGTWGQWITDRDEDEEQKKEQEQVERELEEGELEEKEQEGRGRRRRTGKVTTDCRHSSLTAKTSYSSRAECPAAIITCSHANSSAFSAPPPAGDTTSDRTDPCGVNLWMRSARGERGGGMSGVGGELEEEAEEEEGEGVIRGVEEGGGRGSGERGTMGQGGRARQGKTTILPHESVCSQMRFAIHENALRSSKANKLLENPPHVLAVSSCSKEQEREGRGEGSRRITKRRT
eukprot:237625-Hanusia_phi.AAC.5